RFDRLRALRRDPDRRMRSLKRLREDHRLRDLEDLSVVREGLTGKGFQDDVDRLFPARARAVELEPEALELVVLVAAAEADVHAPAREEIERRDLFGDDERMVEWDHDDGGADAQARGLGRDERGELRRTGQVAVRREVVLREPDVAKVERLRGLRHVDRARVDLLRRPCRWRLHQEERAEL